MVIKVNPASKARIKFESDLFDFGSIPRGSTVSHVFKFRNVGEDTLKITAVKPTCGCTTAPLSSNEIAPGQEANIKATFNSQKFNGRVTKQIYVDSSDPISPYLKVSFSATINDPLQTVTVSPLEADMGTVQKGKTAQAKVGLLNTADAGAEFTIVETSLSLKAVLSKKTLGPNESAELSIDLASQDAVGEFHESITIETTGSEAKRFSVPVKATITE